MKSFMRKINPFLYSLTFLLTIGWILAETGWYSKIQYFSIPKHYPKSGWEPIVFLVTLVSGARFLQSSQATQREVNLAKQFLIDFPSDGFSAPFLKEHDMGNSFHNNKLTEIEHFIDNWIDAEHEFTNNNKVEKMRKLFHSECSVFYDKLMSNVFQRGNPDYWTMDIEEFTEQPEKMCNMRDLNIMARDLYDTHQKFVRMLLTIYK